ncbi:HVO_0234 family beta-propeller protein, partial [Candidatus Halobonum tyrrellensis]
MSTLAEKRVFTEQADTTRVLVASSLGVVGVSVSGDLVGEFGVDHRCTARDVAAGGGALAVATDEDVLVGDFQPTGHGPAVAVSLDRRATDAADSDAADPDATGGATVLAAAPDGTVSRLDAGDDEGSEGGGGTGDDEESEDGDGAADPEWTALGRVDDPRRMDGPLVAAADGVHRVVADRVEYAGLDDARDVAAGGVPLAATGEGLYALGNGWLCERESDGDGDGGFRAVTADAAGERALAATEEAVYERADATAEWVRHDESGVVAVAVAGDL